MADLPTFPQDLLEKSNDDRRSYFDHKIVMHPKFTDVITQVKHLLLDPSCQMLIVIYGPPGSGKTFLANEIYKYIIESNRPKMEANKGIIPVVSVEAPAPRNSNFSWWEYFVRIMTAAQEPLIKFKISDEEYKQFGTKTPKHSPSPAAMRESAIDCIKYRETKLIITDEAGHFLSNKNDDALRGQMDVIKQFYSDTKARNIFFGPYSLIDLCYLNGQLGRRIEFIHFSRYHPTPIEFQQFYQTIYTLQLALPLRQRSNLLAHSDYLFEKSLGCVGRLKDWLSRALELVLEENKGKNEKITKEILERTVELPGKLQKGTEEIIDGENKDEELRKGKIDLSKFSIPDKVKKALRNKSQTTNQADITVEKDQPDSGDPNASPPPKKRGRKPGDQNPRRKTMEE